MRIESKETRIYFNKDRCFLDCRKVSYILDDAVMVETYPYFQYSAILELDMRNEHPKKRTVFVSFPSKESFDGWIDRQKYKPKILWACGKP